MPKHPGCDSTDCRYETGEIRRFPLRDNAGIHLCLPCYQHAATAQAAIAIEDEDYKSLTTYPKWEELPVVPQGEDHAEETSQN